jgi:chromosome segregation ATPase
MIIDDVKQLRRNLNECAVIINNWNKKILEIKQEVNTGTREVLNLVKLVDGKQDNISAEIERLRARMERQERESSLWRRRYMELRHRRKSQGEVDDGEEPAPGEWTRLHMLL